MAQSRSRSPFSSRNRYTHIFHPLLKDPRLIDEQADEIIGTYKKYLATKGIAKTGKVLDFIAWFDKDYAFEQVEYSVSRKTMDALMKKSPTGLMIFFVSYHVRTKPIGHTFAIVYSHLDNTIYNLNTGVDTLSDKVVYHFALHYDLGMNVQMEFENQYRALNIGIPRTLAYLQTPMDQFCAAWRIVIADNYIDQYLNTQGEYGFGVKIENIFKKMIMIEPKERVNWLRWLFNRIVVDKLGYMDVEDIALMDEKMQVIKGNSDEDSTENNDDNRMDEEF